MTCVHLSSISVSPAVKREAHVKCLVGCLCGGMDSQAKLNISSETDDATRIPRKDEKSFAIMRFLGESMAGLPSWSKNVLRELKSSGAG